MFNIEQGGLENMMGVMLASVEKCVLDKHQVRLSTSYPNISYLIVLYLILSYLLSSYLVLIFILFYLTLYHVILFCLLLLNVILTVCTSANHSYVMTVN